MTEQKTKEQEVNDAQAQGYLQYLQSPMQIAAAEAEAARLKQLELDQQRAKEEEEALAALAQVPPESDPPADLKPAVTAPPVESAGVDRESVEELARTNLAALPADDASAALLADAGIDPAMLTEKADAIEAKRLEEEKKRLETTTEDGGA